MKQIKQFTTYAIDRQGVTKEKDLIARNEADEPRIVESGLISLYPEITYQEIEGFGGALTETAGYLFSTLTEENQAAFLEEYFGENGLKYRFVRMPIDSCDYSLSEYQAVEDPLMRKIRQLDKLIDELAKGKPMEKILR